MINILCTSKPHDGLLYYSYEYCSYLNAMNVEAQLVIVCHPDYLCDDYTAAISTKYIHCEHIVFNDYFPMPDETTLIMGRSMLTLAYFNFEKYDEDQKFTVKMLFSEKLISVYSENHPLDYPKALEFFGPDIVHDICDTEVYVNGVGDHFEKTINFSIYKPIQEDIQFKYLLNGTSKEYYSRIMDIIHKYDESYGIITYDDEYIDPTKNNIIAPIENVLGLFETYVYSKNTFDPAPRIIQECKYFNKRFTYDRDCVIIDGGSVYHTRDVKEPNVEAILKCL